MKRRQFVQGVGAAGSWCAGTVTGCATTGGANGPRSWWWVAMAVAAAKYVRMWSDYGDVTGSAQQQFHFAPSPIWCCGSKTMADITPYDNLSRRHGVRLVQDMVTRSILKSGWS